MPVDLIVLAAVVIFILLRLYGVLGQKIGHDQPPQHRDSTFEDNGMVIELPPREIEQVATSAPEEEIEEDLDLLTKTGLQQIREHDKSFRRRDFLDGAKIAFEMVLNAFSKDDRDTLKMLLSKEIYEEFLTELKNRDTQETYTDTTLVSIMNAEITSVEVKNATAVIKVSFTSEQIQAERDKKGKVVSDSASQIEHVVDEWTFERNLKSSNPNWTIIST
jgi:predicted lipid-binding transport protein (Tim44 family)